MKQHKLIHNLLFLFGYEKPVAFSEERVFDEVTDFYFLWPQTLFSPRETSSCFT